MEVLQKLSDDKIRQEIYDSSDDGLAVSEAEYWENFYDDGDFVYEWNRGYLELKPLSTVGAGRLYQWFLTALSYYFDTFPAGQLITLNIGFRVALPEGVSIRRPDLAMVLYSNPDAIADDDCVYKGTFDLCVESLSYFSQKEIERDTVVKKSEYEGIGVKEYYILDAREKETVFYRLNPGGKYEKIRPDRGIIRSGILPGFQFRVSDLYRQPPPEEMAEDRVYYKYFLPFYQRGMLHAERHRAEEAEELLIMERQRSAHLVAKLRELGIFPDA
ncbi:Uma2 family endonuclease [Desulfococcaceae bacterium HSG8]|nr:Uma2 family endonuclease [Desulfococcaceae bacterium HSG8]